MLIWTKLRKFIVRLWFVNFFRILRKRLKLAASADLRLTGTQEDKARKVTLSFLEDEVGVVTLSDFQQSEVPIAPVDSEILYDSSYYLFLPSGQLVIWVRCGMMLLPGNSQAGAAQVLIGVAEGWGFSEKNKIRTGQDRLSGRPTRFWDFCIVPPVAGMMVRLSLPIAFGADEEDAHISLKAQVLGLPLLDEAAHKLFQELRGSKVLRALIFPGK